MQVSALVERVATIVKKVAHPAMRKGWWHWVRFALLLSLGIYLGHELSESPRFTDWRYALYQKQVRLQRRGPVYPRYTALVLLNDDDYWSDEYQARAPIKRDKLAALLDRLNEAGVNTVAFDFILESPLQSKPDYDFPDYQKEDAVFFAALKRMCDAGRHVVLATEYSGFDEGPKESRVEAKSIYTSHLPSLPCVVVGHIQLPTDLRKIPGMMQVADGRYLDSFSLAITKINDPIAYENLVKDEDRGYRFAQFLTPEDFSTRNGRQFIFSGIDLQRMEIKQLRQSLADKTVIVGGHVHDEAYGIGWYIDMHDSPGGEEPGAMLHANFVEAMRDPMSTFTPISDRMAEIIEFGLALALAILGSMEIHAGWKWAGFSLSCLFSILLTYFLLQNLGLFLDFIIPFFMIVVHTFTEELLEMRRELKHAKHQLLHHQQKEKTT
jgi:CHASE2 domain-containing sensor protein